MIKSIVFWVAIVLAVVGFFMFEAGGNNRRFRLMGFMFMILAIIMFFLSVPNLDMF